MYIIQQLYIRSLPSYSSSAHTGILEGPPELHARAVNSSTVHITWLAPYTLNITSPPSLEPTSYQLLIRQDGDTILSANTTGNEFYYTRENSCQAASYQICVAGRNPVGIGGYSRRNISVSHRCKCMYAQLE